MNPLLKAKIDLLKDVPGTYLMKDKSGNIIYVGKAKSLIKRVKQYFYRPQCGKVFRMVREIADFETIETNSEKEALLLELNLIRKYYPKYNILLKDGKSYPYIALKVDKDPMLKIAYKDKDKKYIYFGPYPSSQSAYKTIDLLNVLFPLRKCKQVPSSPCLYYHLGQCIGPCVNKITSNDYAPLVNDIERFLKGDTKKITAEIKKKMQKAIDNLEFEKAREFKSQLDAITYISEKQNIMHQNHASFDVVAIAKRDFYFAMSILTYRNGNMLGKNSFVIEEEDIVEQEISLLFQYYQNHDNPKELILADEEVKNRLSEILTFKVSVPKRGTKKDLLLIALENAKNAIDEHFMTARLEDNMLELLNEFGTLLHINPPLRIELFDNSHLQGEEPIGAMVCFVNGVKAPSLYRKYNIKNSSGKDDLASMKEVIYRRYNRLKKENALFPDLIIVDGGENQINVAKQSLNDVGVDIPIVGLAKDNHHHTAFLIKDNEVIALKEHEKLFLFLVRMQDEVHRFAITFHRKKREKKIGISLFDDIDGIGIKRKETLLKAYPSIDSLKSATLEELKALVNENIAKEIIGKVKRL